MVFLHSRQAGRCILRGLVLEVQAQRDVPRPPVRRQLQARQVHPVLPRPGACAPALDFGYEAHKHVAVHDPFDIVWLHHCGVARCECIFLAGCAVRVSQDQTPEYPHGDGSCPGPCDCGAVPCGEYLYDHRAGQPLRDWIVNDFVLGSTGLANANVSGFYFGAAWVGLGGHTSVHPCWGGVCVLGRLCCCCCCWDATNCKH